VRRGARYLFRVALGVVTVALLVATVPANADGSEDGWSFRLTPYIWLPRIDGSLKHGLPPGSGGSPEISVGPTDWLDLLNAGLLVSGTASKGRFSLYSDVVYLSLTSKNDGRVLSVDDTITVPGTRIPIPISANLNLDTRTDLDGLTWTIAGGYEVVSTETSSMTAFLGARYFGVDTTASWDLTAEISIPGTGVILPAQGQIGTDVDLWDALIGVRGRFDFGKSQWSTRYHLDVGTGDSDLTWNAMAGLSYAFGWGELLLAYRHLEYDQSENKLLQDFSFSGPGIGVTFTFD
jgi:hypothetical protein